MSRNGLNIKWILVASLACCLLSTATYWNNSNAADVSEQTSKNKLILLESILKKSKRPREVYASGNNKAIKMMDEAFEHYNAAKDLLGRGDYIQSDNEIQKSLKKISTSFRMVVDKESETELALAQYDLLHKRVNSFRDLFNQLPADKVKGLMDINEVNTLIVQAESLYQKKQPLQALKPLTSAADMLEKALSDARKNETVVYSLDFSSPEDEYQYELQRNKNYLELSNLILSSESPDIKKKLPLIKMLIKKNDKLVNEAKSTFQSGDVKQAITLLEKSNKTLVQALRLGGLTL